MTISTKNLYQILVPCNYNDGKPVRTRHHKEWDKRVRKISGGLTIFPPAKGQWIHEDELFEDRVIPVNLMASPQEMERIADMTAKHYKQKAVLYFVLSDKPIIHYLRQ